MAFEKLPKHVVHAPPGPSGAATGLCVGLLSAAAIAFVVFSRPTATTSESIAPAASAGAASAAAAAPARDENAITVSATPPTDSAPAAPKNLPDAEPSPPAPLPAVEAVRRDVEPAVSVIHGSFTQESNALVYDEDALVLLSDGGLLSSPNGVMVSDEKQKLFVGDLTLETGEHTVVGTDAVLDIERGRMTGANMTVTFGSLKGSLKNPAGGTTTIPLGDQEAKK